MIVFLNGKFVPEKKAVVSVFDRAFLLGDGLFETIHFFNGKPFRWQEHMKRLQHGAKYLKIKLPFAPAKLRQFAGELVVKNKMPDGLLRLTLSRGVGPRGYSPKGATWPTLVMALHPAPKRDPGHPPKWKLVVSSQRLPSDEPLARFKNCNKLPQILARAEADAAGADEALLLNTDGCVVEGASSNLFWVADGTVSTPPLLSGILPGVTRAVVLEICSRLKIPVREKNIRLKQLEQSDGIFLSVSSLGVAEAVSLDGKKLRRSPRVGQIARAYNEMLAKL